MATRLMVGMTMGIDVLDEIDKQRGMISRSRFVEALIIYALKHLKDIDELKMR